MRSISTGALTLLLTLLPASAALVTTLPKLTTKTLSGRDISLPGDSGVSAYVLTFGFSHKSQRAVAAWDKRIAPVYSSTPKVTYYEMPVLQDVPRFVKPLVLHGMRRDLSKTEQARFAPVYHDEKTLKEIVHFKDPQAAYVVVASRDGKVVWTSHGPASNSEFAALRKAVSQLVK